jgi:bacterioferritin-associated ferredoxin
MWVCHCRAVTDSKVRDAIAAGADDEIEIGRVCGAGTGCGSCHETLRKLCDESRPRSLSERSQQPLVGAGVSV